ncbi:MAG: ABC transporter permease [Burkholderiales bacterium]|nr:ABC transporter permease [Burkholderiales bacterium]
MRRWLRHQRDALNRALKRFAQGPLISLLSVLVIGVTLALPVGFYLVLENLRGIAGHIDVEPQISIFLSMDAGSADVQATEAKLKTHPAIAAFKFVSKDDALKEMQQAIGFGEVLEGLDKNPLPHAFVVRGKSTEPAALQGLRAELATLPKAEHVQLDSAWAKRLASFNLAGQKIMLMLAVALGAALLVVTGNTIRLQILTQRDEIEVGRLLGATDGYLRRPYLYFGALQGLLGGLLGLGLAIAGLLWLAGHTAELVQIYAPGFHPQAVAWQTGTVIVFLAAWLGWLGAYASVALYLQQSSLEKK